MEDQFYREFGLAFFIYFYLTDQKNVKTYRQEYATKLFDYLISLCGGSYQMKYLAYKLLNRGLPLDYKTYMG